MPAKLAAALLAAAAALPAAAGELSLAPAVVQLSGRAGESTTQRLTLRNDTDLPLEFTLEARDVVVRDGKRVQLPPGEIPASIAATAVFSTPAVSIPPGQSRSVDATFTVPPGVRHRAVVAVFRGTTRVGSSTVSLAALLAFTLSDEISVAAAELRAQPQTATANAAFETALRNDGAEPVVPKGVAVVLDERGALVARTPFEPRRVLPGEQVVVRAEYPGELRTGRYRALATFEYAGRTVTRSAELVVPR